MAVPIVHGQGAVRSKRRCPPKPRLPARSWRDPLASDRGDASGGNRLPAPARPGCGWRRGFPTPPSRPKLPASGSRPTTSLEAMSPGQEAPMQRHRRAALQAPIPMHALHIPARTAPIAHQCRLARAFAPVMPSHCSLGHRQVGGGCAQKGGGEGPPRTCGRSGVGSRRAARGETIAAPPWRAWRTAAPAATRWPPSTARRPFVALRLRTAGVPPKPPQLNHRPSVMAMSMRRNTHGGGGGAHSWSRRSFSHMCRPLPATNGRCWPNLVRG